MEIKMKKPFVLLKSYFTPADNITSKTNNFNIIRFAAAFFVIYGHMNDLMGVPCTTLLTQRISTVGVEIFFLISGFLITKSYLSDTHMGRYMIRRTCRIFPALITVVLVTVFVLGPIATTLTASEYFTHPLTWNYLKNLLLSPIYSLPGVFGDYVYPNTVNGSLWTLPVEFAMYLILPALIVLFKKLRRVKSGLALSALAVLTLSCLRIQLFPDWRLVVWGTNIIDTFNLLPYFFVGSLFSFPEMRKILNLQLGVVMIILTAIIAPAIPLEFVREILIFLTLPYFILSLSLTERPIFSRWFASSDFSYGLYLYAFPVQQILSHKTAHLGLSVLTMSLICFAVILVIAVFSWHFIEKNGQKLGQYLIKRIGRAKKSEDLG